MTVWRGRPGPRKAAGSAGLSAGIEVARDELTARNRRPCCRIRSENPTRRAAQAQRISNRRDVAQPGRALAWGARGRQFKSARPDHFRFRSLAKRVGISLPVSLVAWLGLTSAKPAP